jgi:hypothetical protein
MFTALHPVPLEDECNTQTESCFRHRLAMLSWAILNPQHGYRHPHVNAFVEKFHATMAQGNTSTADMVQLAISFVAKTRLQSDQLPGVYFTHTAIPYRDDNRHLWQFIEESDDEEFFDESKQSAQQELQGLPPRHYPEWDYSTQTYRPDWTSVYESLHPAGNPAVIDALLAIACSLGKETQTDCGLAQTAELHPYPLSGRRQRTGFGCGNPLPD